MLSRTAAKICLNGGHDKDVTQAAPTIFCYTPQGLIVEYTLLISNSEGANTLPTSTLAVALFADGEKAPPQSAASELIVECTYFKSFHHFCGNCRIFCEGV
jgi:hypothetical protein